VVWTPDKQKRLQALGFSYNEDNDKWTKVEKDHDEFVWSTASFLYWFSAETTNGGKIRGSNKFPIMDFDALIIFLRAIQAMERLENEI
jgi:hypothetical protein